METDIRIVSIDTYFTREAARVPLKFGGVVMDEAYLAYVRATVENRAGGRSEGWGSIFMSDVWAWPSPVVDHATREAVMCDLVRAWGKRVAEFSDYAHPIDIHHQLEAELEPLAARLCSEHGTAERMPRLCALVCASPVDAAVHDAWGNAAGIDCYDGYGPSHVTHDLSAWLGADFKNKYIADYLSPMPDRLDAFHLVGGLDKLRESEITDDDPQDGLPVSLDQWVRHEQLHCLKIKLRGVDLDWDVDRICSVVAVTREAQAKLGVDEIRLTADTNEQCESPDYCVELLSKLRERDPAAFDSLLYLEQPCERDLRRRMLDVRELSALKPVVIDEALASLDDFKLALELGYTGVALKSCKCQSAELVIAAKASQLGIPYTIQDLTNPGIALLHSVGLAGHLSPIMGVESNSRQFFPSASEAEKRVHPGVYHLQNGRIDTTTLRGPGLGYRWSEIGRRFDAAS
jgi:L-alanine-DL-glutamate epimerase-like enolase superfamily enzyme